MFKDFDGIIFDVDGTLWDSTDVVAGSYNAIFEKYGLPARVDGDLLKKLFGKPMDVIFASILPEVDPERRAELAEECEILENEDLKKNYAPYYPEIVETMAALSKKLPLFVVSNCQKGYIEIVLEGAHLEPYFKDFLCFGDTGTSKGQTILTLMKKNGIKNPIYVGDIQGDANACKEAGIPIIHAAYGFGTIEEPYAVIHELKELRTLFGVEASNHDKEISHDKATGYDMETENNKETKTEKENTMITREDAYALLKKYNQDPFHLQHGITVEAVMKWYAEKLGYTDEIDYWGTVGLLHDIDFELYPEQHCQKAPELLAVDGITEDMVHAVCSHGYGICSEVEPTREMEKVLFAADELTGLIWASALMRPSKSTKDMDLKSLKKKYKSKSFAAGCDRGIIARGAEQLGWDLEKLLQMTLEAMQDCEDVIAEKSAAL